MSGCRRVDNKVLTHYLQIQANKADNRQKYLLEREN